NVADLIEPNGESRCDGIGVHSAYWASRTAGALRIVRHDRPETSIDDAGIVRTIEAKATVVGFPEMDQLPDIDRSGVRQRLGLSPSQPVVVYAPFPFMSNPRPFWVRHVYGARNRLHQRLALAVARRREYRSHVE